MPTYEYKCDACGHLFEKFQSIKADPIKVCPTCGVEAVHRLISAGAGFIFKGSGFYITDYREKGYADQAKADKAAGEPAKADKPADGPAATPAVTPAPRESKSNATPAAPPTSAPAPAPAAAAKPASGKGDAA